MVSMVELYRDLTGMSLNFFERQQSEFIDVNVLPSNFLVTSIPRRPQSQECFDLRVAAKTLHRRGISRDRIETSLHPLPDHDGTYAFSPLGVEIPYSMGPTTTIYSGRSSPTITDSEDRSIHSISIGGVTGNSTERSSIISLGEDHSHDEEQYSDYLGNRDFEREATREVRAMFEDIDSTLFENRAGPSHLAGECKEWIKVFPHLRILGHQLVPPQDMGFQIIPGETPRSNGSMLMDVTEHDISQTHAVNELTVMGQHVRAQKAPLDLVRSRLSDVQGREEFTSLEEEIIEQDGNVEDIIAVDYKSSAEEDARSHATHRRRQRGMPPITPQACVKDNIGGAAFDYIWSESISWLRHMLQRYADNVVLDHDDLSEKSLNLQPFRALHHNDVFPGEFSPAREHSFIPSRESSILMSRQKGLTLGSLLGPPEGLKLEGCLTISSKALQSREKSSLGEQMDFQGIPAFSTKMRPMSSLQKMVDQTRPGTGSQSRLASARWRRNQMPPRLAPLERTKTPSVEEDRHHVLGNEVVRGRGIPVNDRHNSPPLPLTRIGALPPISLDTDLHNTSQKPSQRASSAMPSEMRLNLKEEKTVLGISYENRPNTTHALYRSETPQQRRSSTPMNVNMMRLSTGAAPVSSNPVLNVTGNSINNPVAEGELEEPDNYDDIVASPTTRWEPSYRRLLFRQYEGANLNPQVRRTKQQHTNVVR